MGIEQLKEVTSCLASVALDLLKSGCLGLGLVQCRCEGRCGSGSSEEVEEVWFRCQVRNVMHTWKFILSFSSNYLTQDLNNALRVLLSLKVGILHILKDMWGCLPKSNWQWQPQSTCSWSSIWSFVCFRLFRCSVVCSFFHTWSEFVVAILLFWLI